VILLLSGKPRAVILVAVLGLILIRRFPTAGKWQVFIGEIARLRSLRRPG
jgi:hypothetical protein